MKLLPGWAERLENAAAKAEVKPAPRTLPLATTRYMDKVVYVATEDEARNMADLAMQRNLSHIGIDTEFKFDRPGVLIKGKEATDPRSIHPLLMSLAMVEPLADGERQYAFVVDLRKPELLPYLNKILRRPIRFVGHFLKVEFFCCWQLGLTVPNMIWDTWAAEKARYLGKNHRKYKLPPTHDEIDELIAKEEVESEEEFFNSLVPTCHRHGVTHGKAHDKKRLQKSFLDHPDDSPFSEEQIEYAAEDAIAAAALFKPQVLAATSDGILNHLERIEMPWVQTNARIEWNGVKTDIEKCRRVEAACSAHVDRLEPILKKYGIENFRSHNQVEEFFSRHGLLPLFKRDGKHSFERKQLELHMDCHEIMPYLYAVRQVDDVKKSGVFNYELIGVDGRTHSNHRQLGTDTGRQTTRWPNVLGIPRALRPMIVPEEGYGLGEVDLSQIEVGISAAVYGDAALITMFNSGDVYCAMAQHFYAPELSETERVMSEKEFKVARPDMRDRMKICTLGIIYGMTAHGVRGLLKTNETEAQKVMNRFMGMFPALKEALGEAECFSPVLGYAMTASGLRRYRARQSQPSNWELNWLTNHPVQGSAADMFKLAGNRLDRVYQAYGAKLIIPFHDAFVFEAPLEKLGEVAEVTKQELCRAVQEFFPELKPRAEINISRPECWNKDGKADSWEKWLKDPLSFVLRTKGAMTTEGKERRAAA